MTVIEEQAPVVAAAEIEIDASPAAVWEILADFERWPSWNPDVSAVSLEGELAEGTEFHWRAGPGTIRSVLRYVEPPHVLAWTGRTLALDAVHVWRLENEHGATLVRTEESWSGIPARMFRRPLRRMLARSLETGLDHLKLAVEGRER
ncbi:MAG: SRPBCC family protein [Gaiellaceae bacterium]|jgi:uncharacterized protein YndB with AHSA1/START domain